jgi:hypothetical protein
MLASPDIRSPPFFHPFLLQVLEMQRTNRLMMHEITSTVDRVDTMPLLLALVVLVLVSVYS